MNSTTRTESTVWATTRACLIALLLVCASSPLLAQDFSTAHSMLYTIDNSSDGYDATDPQATWRGFDMINYQGRIFEAFFKGYCGLWTYLAPTLYVYSRPADGIPEAHPTQMEIQESDDTYLSSNPAHTALRFAVFRGALYLFDAMSYDGTEYDNNTGFILWARTYNDLTDDFSSDTIKVWENRPNDPSHPVLIQGLLTKVMNDTLYILIQTRNSPDLYLITYDGQTYSTPEKVFTFYDPASWMLFRDCLLNGDVFMRVTDGEPLLAFVTKDDGLGGDLSSGYMRLYVFDPTDKSVTYVTQFAGNWKDMTLVQGNANGCWPYNPGAFQIWAILRDNDTLCHMQFVFNADGKTGAFNPGGYVSAGEVSSHVDREYRGYLASCIASEQVADTTPDGTAVDSIQQYAWVWWWGSTRVDNAYGSSRKYPSNFLKNVGPTMTLTDTEDINDAWILLGVITGLPPYYPNGTVVGKLNSSYLLSYGMETGTKVSTSVSSKRTFSFSYGQTFKFASASIGMGYTNSVEQKSEQEHTVTVSKSLSFGPDYVNPVGIPTGAQAWGVFFVPQITNDRYQLYAPDQATDLNMTLYYTYIGDGSILAKEFDMTNPYNPLNAPFWHGIKTFPNSLDYEGWAGDDTFIPNSETDDYKRRFASMIDSEDSATDFALTETDTTVESQENTNTISVSAGAFGFSAGMEGSLTIASSNSTTFGQHISVHYGLPGWSADQVDPPPDDYLQYLDTMNMYMYLLDPKTENAFWIPDAAKSQARQQHPWCLTWHVNNYRNVASYVTQVGGPESVGGALQSNPDLRNLTLVVQAPLDEGSLLIANRSVHVRGAASTLDRYGNPTLVVGTQGITVEEGAYLKIENLIIVASGSDPAIATRGVLLINNCLIVGFDGADGIVQNGGNMYINKTRIRASGGDGARVANGDASLVNCTVRGNLENGVRNENGTVILKHCALLDNGAYDLSSSSSAVTKSTNCVLGSISPDSTVQSLANCLLESLPESVVIGELDNCLIKKRFGLVIEDGELANIVRNSPCVDAGTATANVAYDMLGKFRWQTPDIGPLEYSQPLVVAGIADLQLDIADADPLTESDSLGIVLDIQTPPGFTLNRQAFYAISFGNHVITSDQFDRSLKSVHGLQFSTESGDSSLRLELLPRQKLLRMTLDLSDVQLYRDIAPYVLNSGDSSSFDSVVYAPIRVSAGDFQTGVCWIDFVFSGQHAVGTGTAGGLRPIY